MFEEALDSRKRAQKQGLLLKLLKVGAYWLKKPPHDFQESSLKAAFCKWKHQCKPTKAPSPASSRTQASIGSQPAQTRATKVDSQTSEVLKWLENFGPARKDVPRVTTLGEFDTFLKSF